jgi:hypothetical protein
MFLITVQGKLLRPAHIFTFILFYLVILYCYTSRFRSNSTTYPLLRISSDIFPAMALSDTSSLSSIRRSNAYLTPGQLAPSKFILSKLTTWTTHPMDNSPHRNSPHDILPIENFPRGQLTPWETRPEDNSPHGQLAQGHFAPWKTRPIEDLPQDISPHGQLTPWTACPKHFAPVKN